MKNNYSVKTILRKDKKRSDDTYPLNYLIIFNSNNLKLSAKHYLTLNEWDFDKNCPKGVGNSILKKKLQQEEKFIYNNLIELELSGKPLTKDLIKEKCSGNIAKKDFYHYFDEYCKKKFRLITTGTQSHYILFKKQLKEYKSTIELEEIDVKFIENFLYYLSVEKKVGISGIATRRKTFSAVLNKFVVDKIIKENPCKYVKVQKEKVKTVFLTSKEIGNIINADLKMGNLTDGLNLTRNLFLFSCYCGLRYSDVANLKNENIIDSKKIVLEMVKTKDNVEIPLHDLAMEILKKHRVKSKSEKDFVFRKRSNVSVNRDLKIIAKIAKIKKDLTFHVGRHSFGSMLAKSNTQPFYIMKLMGHKDIRMTERYVNSDEEILSNAMRNVKFD
ncbi:site-specific recombinase XerD [Flavobacterium cutihirudinis]|uniref:Site-specific recombinase XerD n=2 Tax=Flavobacterium cutihirudinis TaxID=1265740 RepID=A0A3D9G137_9FLAO|nr:site-specific recombinase XerD [Flavobacterium cutihirudinis]